MKPFGSRRWVEEFAAVVDGHAAPSEASIATAVAVVDRIRSIAPEPSTAFRLDLRERLLTAAATELLPARRRPRPSPVVRTPAAPPRRRRFGALAGAAVIVGSSLSLVAASADAMPGELLYPVKRAAEDVELLVRSDLVTEGRLQLEHAATRLDEVDGLTHSDDVGSVSNTLLISATLEDFTSQAREGAADLIAAFEQHDESATIEELNGFSVSATLQLRSLAAVVPAGAGQEFADTADAVVDLTARTSAACRSCADVDEASLAALRTSAADLVPEADDLTVSAGDMRTTVVELVRSVGLDKQSSEPTGPEGDANTGNPTEPSTPPQELSSPSVPSAGDRSGDGRDPGGTVADEPDVPDVLGGPNSIDGSPSVPEVPTDDIPEMPADPLGQGGNQEEGDALTDLLDALDDPLGGVEAP